MTEPSTTETKIEQIVKGIDGLSEEDYTSTGIPRVEALEAITGIAEITGDERDEAWVKHQAENPTKDPESPEAAEAAEAAEAGEGGATEDAEAEEASAEPEAVVGATEDRPTGSPQETTPEAAKVAEVAEAPYVVAEGKAITSRKGILGPGAAVFPLYFGANGAAIIKKLEEDGMVVAT